jgi:hypothetical protein
MREGGFHGCCVRLDLISGFEVGFQLGPKPEIWSRSLGGKREETI